MNSQREIVPREHAFRLATSDSLSLSFSASLGSPQRRHSVALRAAAATTAVPAPAPAPAARRRWPCEVPSALPPPSHRSPPKRSATEIGGKHEAIAGVVVCLKRRQRGATRKSSARENSGFSSKGQQNQFHRNRQPRCRSHCNCHKFDPTVRLR